MAKYGVSIDGFLENEGDLDYILIVEMSAEYKEEIMEIDGVELVLPCYFKVDTFDFELPQDLNAFTSYVKDLKGTKK